MPHAYLHAVTHRRSSSRLAWSGDLPITAANAVPAAPRLEGRFVPCIAAAATSESLLGKFGRVSVPAPTLAVWSGRICVAVAAMADATDEGIVGEGGLCDGTVELESFKWVGVADGACVPCLISVLPVSIVKIRSR